MKVENNAKKLQNFDCTTIADRFMTANKSDHCYLTGVVKADYGDLNLSSHRNSSVIKQTPYVVSCNTNVDRHTCT